MCGLVGHVAGIVVCGREAAAAVSNGQRIYYHQYSIILVKTLVAS